MYIHHIVLSVKNLERSTKFYGAFLGKPRITKWDVSWKIGNTKLFLSLPNQENRRKFDKNNLGLNHLAFGLRNKSELKKFHLKLSKSKIKNSGMLVNKWSKKEYIFFDDPDGIRLEFFL